MLLTVGLPMISISLTGSYVVLDFPSRYLRIPRISKPSLNSVFNFLYKPLMRQQEM